MYTEKELQTLKDFAKSIHSKYTHLDPFAEGFEEYLVCKTDFMMTHPKAKCNTEIITLRDGKPHLLTWEEELEICRRLKRKLYPDIFK